VVNNLTRLRPTRRERYRVTIFGSARVPEVHWVYAAVRDVAEELTRLGCDFITGGGPGLMAAANKGTRRPEPGAVRRRSAFASNFPSSRKRMLLAPMRTSIALSSLASTGLC
jgi:hypothetical protein